MALVGMICVYRFQTMHTSRWAVMNRTSETREYYFGDLSFRQTATEFVEAWRERKAKDLSSAKVSPYFGQLEEAEVAIVDLLRCQEEIRSKFVIFLLVNLTVIFLCISALPFCKDLVSPGGILTVILTITILAECLVLTGNLCISLIPQGKIFRDQPSPNNC